MSKVGVHIGFTLKLSKDSFEYIRPDISIEEVDTEKDVDAQLSAAVDAFNKTWKAVNAQVEEKVITQFPNLSAQMETAVVNEVKKLKARIIVIEDTNKQKVG
jgi:hypothetical protein